MKLNKITKLMLILLMGASGITAAAGHGGGGFHGGGFGGGGRSFGGGRGFEGRGFREGGFERGQNFRGGGFYGGVGVAPIVYGAYADDDYLDYDPDYNPNQIMIGDDNDEYYD